MYRLELALEPETQLDDLPLSSTSLPDRIAESILLRAETLDRSVAEVIADELAAAFPPNSPPIKFGENSFTMVLNFSTGQNIYFPLKLRDRDFVGSEVFLKGAELQGARLIVQPKEEVDDFCKRHGHNVEPVVSTRPLPAFGGSKTVSVMGTSSVNLSCRDCGVRICLILGERTDVDAYLARVVSDGVMTGSPDEHVLTQHVANVDRLRRRLAARQEELSAAQERLESAAAVLARQMMKLAPQC